MLNTCLLCDAQSIWFKFSHFLYQHQMLENSFLPSVFLHTDNIYLMAHF